MKSNLKEYLEEILSNGLEKNYWFVTKQTLKDFYFPFFIAKIVEKFSKQEETTDFATFYTKCFKEDPYMAVQYPKQCESTNTFRNAIIAEFFGLINRANSSYNTAKPTPAYYNIAKYVKTHDDMDKYKYLVDRQIEKFCVNINKNSKIYDNIKEITNFPIILLYKIMLLLKERYGDSKLSFTEFSVFLARSTSYETVQTIFNLIEQYRENTDETIKKYIDTIMEHDTTKHIRYDAIIGTLNHIHYDNGNSFSIIDTDDSYSYIENAVESFEQSKIRQELNKVSLLKFMQSDKYFIGKLDQVAKIIEDRDDTDKLIKHIVFCLRNNTWSNNIEVNERTRFISKFPLEKIKTLTLKEYNSRAEEDNFSLTNAIENYTNSMGSGSFGIDQNKIFRPIKDSDSYEIAKTHERKIKSRYGENLSVEDFFDKFKMELYESLVNFSLDTYHPDNNFRLNTLRTKLVNIYYPNTIICYTSEKFGKRLCNKLGIKLNENEDSLSICIKITNKIIGKLKEKLSLAEQDEYLQQYNRIRDIIWNYYGTEESVLEDQEEEIMDKDIQQEYEKYSKEDFLQEVFMNENYYDTIRDLLLNKNNIILQGPPGVGKTFLAKRLAYSIIGQKPKDDKLPETHIKAVQFHQSYAYEDFVEGFRPKEDGTYRLVSGIFYDFCENAKKHKEDKFFFIIDEINRGNLSKIFGELLMLIESDKRENTSLNLAYSNRLFSVPKNVYIIGMMNTADRGLTMIDYALRRRFCFFDIEPAFGNSELINLWKKNGIDDDLISKINSNFIRLNQIIKADESLGSGFRIGHSYFCSKPGIDSNQWYNNIIKYEIAPLLKEYWFDNKDEAEEYINSLEIR